MRGWDVAAGAAAAAAADDDDDDDDNDNDDEKMDDDDTDVDAGANDRGAAGCGVGGPLVVLLPPADDAGADNDAQAGVENTGASPSRSLRMFEFAFNSPATKASFANVGAPTPVSNSAAAAPP